MYTVQQLARLAGVTTRALRYYDKIGLLPPARVGQNGYRLYGHDQVEALQQILLYREMGLPLQAIRPLLGASRQERQAALQRQLAALQAEQQRLGALICTVEKTICTLKGEDTMTDQERFRGLKRELLAENERRYGDELRQRYDAKALAGAGQKLQAMDEAAWQQAQALEEEIRALLAQLAPQGAAALPGDPRAAQLVALHRRWLCCHWPDGLYTPAVHRGMADLYETDPRFAAYYDRAAPGGCAVLCAAIRQCCAG